MAANTEFQIEGLKKLLAHSKDGRSRLETVDLNEPSSSDDGPVKIPSKPGTVFLGHNDEYTVVRSLGGVSGSYEATDSDRKRVFTKSYDQGGHRLQTFWYAREHQATKAVSEHDIAPPILDTGYRKPLIVQPYIDGKDLSDVIDGAPLDAETATRVMIPILDKLSLAHKAGWVHRDLKPANIRHPKGDKTFSRPYINDWGFSYNTKLHKHEKHKVGTLLYRSPEQLRKKDPFADERSDLYSLGVILYELTTGKNPRERLSSDERKKQPRLPYNPREYWDGADKTLAYITIRATQPDPARRYQTAEEFAEDLKRPTMFSVGEER